MQKDEQNYPDEWMFPTPLPFLPPRSGYIQECPLVPPKASDYDDLGKTHKSYPELDGFTKEQIRAMGEVIFFMENLNGPLAFLLLTCDTEDLKQRVYSLVNDCLENLKKDVEEATKNSRRNRKEVMNATS